MRKTERDIEVYRNILDDVEFSVIGKMFKLSAKQVLAIMQEMTQRLVAAADLAEIAHPFTFEKYPHAYTTLWETQRVVGALLRRKDVLTEREFLAIQLEQYACELRKEDLEERAPQLGDPNYGGLLNPEDYKVIQDADVISVGEVRRVLNENGAARFTVCPECRIDDFTHVEGCPLISQI